MFVSSNGRSSDSGIDAFLNLCKKYNLLLIEDSAQSLGSYYPDGVHIGRKGIIGSFSFSAPKIISTGQGGALITDDDDIALKLRRLKDFGRDGGGSDIHASIGFNFKFTELQAVIGIEQMKKLPDRIKRKKEIFSKFKLGLNGLKDVQIFENDITFTAPWFIDVLVKKREDLMLHLKDNGIGTRVMYPPINKQKAYNIDGFHPVSENIGKEGLWLPSMVQLTNAQIDTICSNIKDFYTS